MRIKKHKNKSTPPPILGIILPLRWNEQGKPSRIAIHTDDKKEYQIDFGGSGKELLNLTHKRVAVQGKLRQQLNGQEILSVRQYHVINDAPEKSEQSIKKI